MENTAQAAAVGGIRREPSTDPVKAQGILSSVSKKEKHAARIWQQRWGFLSQVQEIQEEEARNIGMPLEEYRAAVRSVSCKPEKEISVIIDPSPMPLPVTSSGVIGRRAKCILERFGPIVKRTRDYPIQPPLPSGQIYNPYNQTIMFLGSVDGDPISYKLPPARYDVTDKIWGQPQKLDVGMFDLNSVMK